MFRKLHICLSKPSHLAFKSISSIPESIFSGVLNRVKDPIERKRVLIAINMALAQITIFVGLFLFATIKGYNSEAAYYTLIAAGMISIMLFLTYKGYYKFGITFGLIIGSISVIFMAQRVGPTAGADHYYIILGVVPFVFFGYRDRIIAISLTTFAFICFLITTRIQFNFIQPMLLSTEQSFAVLFINSIIAFLFSAYTLVKILEIGDAAEKEALQKKALTEVQNEELKRVNLELDKFVYSASHDLSSPLKSIGGLIHISKMENPPAGLREYLDLMQKSVSKLEAFIRDIISYSRNSRMPVKNDIIDVSSLVKSIWEDHVYYFNQQSNIDLIIENNLSSSFYSDESRLRIIFNNLLSNAIKFHLEEEREQPYVKVVAQENEHEYLFEVADNGRGMNEEIRKDIFEMFFRGSTGIPGSGLGLYILKEAVEKLKGEVVVESEEDKGSSFKICFPKKSAGVSTSQV